MQQTTTTTWIDNKIYLCKLWPKYKPTPEEGDLLNERWGSLKQDILRECIKQHRLERDSRPDLSAIHKAYCKITATAHTAGVASTEIEDTRAQVCVPPSASELADWDTWAAKILETVTDEEIEAVRETMTYVPTTSRVLAVAVEHVRLQGRRVPRRGVRG